MQSSQSVQLYTIWITLLRAAFIDGCYSDLVVGPDGRLYASDANRGLIGIIDMEDGIVSFIKSQEHLNQEILPLTWRETYM